MVKITFPVKNTILFFFVGVLCAFFMVATQVQGSWTSGGPNQTLISGLAVDPTSSDTVFATLSGGESSLATTTNGGTSWDYLVDSSWDYFVDSPTDLGAIAVDPQNPSTIFVGRGMRYTTVGQIFKSSNGGQSWGYIRVFALYETTKVGVSDIWIDPSDSSTIFVAVQGGTDFVGMDGGGVYRSTDGGGKWYRRPVWLTIQSVTTLASDPKDPQTLYYGTTGYGYVFKSTSGGSGWTRISPGGKVWGSVRDIEVDLNSHVYAATSEGLMKWDGSDWTELTGLSEHSIQAIAIDRNASPETIYAGTGEDGVFVSEDAGNTWASFNEGLENLSITTLAISNSLPKVLYAGTEYGGVWSEVLDSTPPTVTSTTPADNATDVAVNTSITATFSETMDSLTITTATFTVSTGGSDISGTVTYSGTTATFTPATDFDFNTTYTATITTGAKDSAGNALETDYTWSFTTGSVIDTTPPTVSSTSPANGVTDVAVNTAITATFSEAMNASTITTDTFLVNDGTANIEGTVTEVTQSGTTATFTPATDFDFNTTYTATITTGAKDSAGNALETDYTWSFTTQSEAEGGGGRGCFISVIKGN